MTLEALGYAFLGGILPALLWLYFLLREDTRCPEPRKLIALAFFCGMLAVPLALWLETRVLTMTDVQRVIILAWATIEEVAKYAVAALFILWRRQVDESPDFVIYMLTVGLGFAALENMLFILAPLAAGNVATAIVTDNLRFIGSTLVHVVSSSIIGFSLAFSYRARPMTRTIAASIGVILAIALHAYFNLLIINEDGSHVLAALFTVWTGTVVFFALFEILKYFQYRRLPKNAC